MYVEKLTDLANKRNISKLVIEIVSKEIKSTNLEISYGGSPGYKSRILLIHSRYVYRNIDGKKIFKQDRFMDLEEYVKYGLREYVNRRSDVFWALLVGLTGIIGLLVISLPKIRNFINKVKKMIDEDGDLVYLLISREGVIIPLLKISKDNNKIVIFSGLALSLKIAGYYIVRLSYPDTYTSWEDALGLEQDPKLEVVSEPAQLGSL